MLSQTAEIKVEYTLVLLCAHVHVISYLASQLSEKQAWQNFIFLVTFLSFGLSNVCLLLGSSSLNTFSAHNLSPLYVQSHSDLEDAVLFIKTSMSD